MMGGRISQVLSFRCLRWKDPFASLTPRVMTSHSAMCFQGRVATETSVAQRAPIIIAIVRDEST